VLLERGGSGKIRQFTSTDKFVDGSRQTYRVPGGIFLLLHFFHHRFCGSARGHKKTKKLETSDMNHFFMLNEVTRHIIVDDNAATNTLVNDENGNEMDISLCMDIFSTLAKEDVFRDDDELNISFGRKGSNGSPVCVSAYFDDAIGYSTSSFDSEVDVVNDNTVVETDVVDVDEIMEFVDPDKLEKAISELCDPILKQERKGLFQLNYSPCVCIAGSK
jgi:hypothetical protein